ncbi:MAG: glutaredoxin family protein [Planctomycetaceae bacterium]
MSDDLEPPKTVLLDDEEPFRRGRVLLGTAAMYAGVGLMVCIGMDRAGRFLPYVFAKHAAGWFLLGAGLLGVSVLLLKQWRPPNESWRPTRPGVRFGRVVLYTREDCHLCHHAKDALVKHAAWLPPIEEIDIDEDPGLRARYGECVPVVVIDGQERFRGQVDERLLRRLIEGAPPQSPVQG